MVHSTRFIHHGVWIPSPPIKESRWHPRYDTGNKRSDENSSCEKQTNTKQRSWCVICWSFLGYKMNAYQCKFSIMWYTLLLWQCHIIHVAWFETCHMTLTAVAFSIAVLILLRYSSSTWCFPTAYPPIVILYYCFMVGGWSLLQRLHHVGMLSLFECSWREQIRMLHCSCHCVVAWNAKGSCIVLIRKISLTPFSIFDFHEPAIFFKRWSCLSRGKQQWRLYIEYTIRDVVQADICRGIHQQLVVNYPNSVIIHVRMYAEGKLRSYNVHHGTWLSIWILL